MSGNKIRVLHLFENYLHTSQNWAFNVINNLEKVQSFVCSYKNVNKEFYSSEITEIAIPSYVNDNLVHEKRNSRLFLMGDLVRRLNYKLSNARFLSYLSNQIKENNIGIIHCHFANIGWHMLPLKKMTGLPFVVSFYGFDYESLPYSFPKWKARYAKLFEIADLFICEGPHGASILKGMGCRNEKIRVVNLGVEFDAIYYFQREKKPGELSLLQMSNYSEKKGHIYTVKAFKKALEKCPGMTLTLVGSGYTSTENEIKAFISDNGLQQSVKMINRIPAAEMYRFMHAQHIFIQPSCYAANRDCEGGAPIVLLDAQATGMPVISTRHCDIPEEVIDNKTGFLSDERDVDGLAASIQKFYEMGQEDYNNFSKAARTYVGEKFDVKNTSKKMEMVYDSFRGKITQKISTSHSLAAAFIALFTLTIHMKLYIASSFCGLAKGKLNNVVNYFTHYLPVFANEIPL